tara:strand:- start:42 stop:359 length:318 start_codon:yes stop_codon:yes gene_type:complete
MITEDRAYAGWGGLGKLKDRQFLGGPPKPKMTNSCDSVIILLAVFLLSFPLFIPFGLLLHEKNMFIPCIVILAMLDLLVFDEAAPGADAKDERRRRSTPPCSFEE